MEPFRTDLVLYQSVAALLMKCTKSPTAIPCIYRRILCATSRFESLLGDVEKFARGCVMSSRFEGVDGMGELICRRKYLLDREVRTTATPGSPDYRR
jgi:hypothetical protein